MPFRVKVLLSDFFNDYRKVAYVSVNDELWTNVKSLQDHISSLFKIPSNIYLTTEDGILIPTLENIGVIKAKDVLIVKNAAPNSSPDIVTSSPNRPRNEVPQLEFSDDSNELRAKRKRKRVKKKQLPHGLSFEEVSQELEHIFSGPPESISFLKGQGKHTRFNESSEDANTSTVDKDEEVVSPHPKYRLTEARPPNARAEIQYVPPRVIQGVEILSKTHTSPVLTAPDIISSTAVVPTEPVAQPAQSNTTAMEDIRQNVDDLNLPILTELPNENDVIAFKYLRVGENYTPQLSEYIVGMVESVDQENQNLKIYILAGNEQVVKPNGKFAVMLMEVEGNEEEENTLVLNWRDLLQPRVVRV